MIEISSDQSVKTWIRTIVTVIEAMIDGVTIKSARSIAMP